MGFDFKNAGGEMFGDVNDVFFKDQNKWYPPIIYAVSNILFDKGYKDDAAMWFYIAQLRARYDANRCNDDTARSAVAILNEKYGAKINEYALKDIDKLKTIVDNAVEFVQEYEGTYDPRWINLHGMWSINGIEQGQTLSYPESEWPAIKKKSIDEYEAGFKKHVLKSE